jgi:hypothetical protein
MAPTEDQRDVARGRRSHDDPIDPSASEDELLHDLRRWLHETNLGRAATQCLDTGGLRKVNQLNSHDCSRRETQLGSRSTIQPSKPSLCPHKGARSRPARKIVSECARRRIHGRSAAATLAWITSAYGGAGGIAISWLSGRSKGDRDNAGNHSHDSARESEDSNSTIDEKHFHPPLSAACGEA